MDKYILTICIFVSLSFNLTNLFWAKNYEKKNKVQLTYQGITIKSPDNEYYLTPPENYLAGKGWKRSPPIGEGTYFRRVPGYSLIYFVFRSFMNVEGTLITLIIFQNLLFFLSIYTFYKILFFLNANKTSQSILTLAYGCLPFFSTYTFFTLTESLSPYLIVFYLYFLFKADYENKGIKNYILASFFIGYAILTRPYTGVLGILLPIYISKNHFQAGWKTYLHKMILAGFVPLLMIGTWTARNYALTGEIVILEKFNHPETLDVYYKPESAAFNKFMSAWGADPEDARRMPRAAFISSVVQGDTSDKSILKMMSFMPKELLSSLGKKQVFEAIKAYQMAIYSQRDYVLEKRIMPSEYNQKQLQAIYLLGQLRKEYISKFPLDYYVKVPLQFLKEIVLHSNTSGLFIFQEPNRDIFILNLYRYFLVLFHILTYSLIIINLYFYRRSLIKLFAFCFIPMIYIFFFTFYIRFYEQRYLLPILPIIFLGWIPIMNRILEKTIFLNAKKN